MSSAKISTWAHRPEMCRAVNYTPRKPHIVIASSVVYRDRDQSTKNCDALYFKCKLLSSEIILEGKTHNSQGRLYKRVGYAKVLQGGVRHFGFLSMK